MSVVTRRRFLQSIPAMAAVSRLAGQTRKPQIPVFTLSHATLTVSDPARSLKFYQDLFGMPIQARQGTSPSLQIGSGPEFIFIASGAPLSAAGRAIATGPKPGINHFCVTMENFNVDAVEKTLAERGITKAATANGLAGGPLTYRVRMRPESQGGAKEGTPEIYIGDPDGLVVQIQDNAYCGGAGPLGEVCAVPPEPSPSKGLLNVKDLSHFTLGVSDAARSLEFYQSLFALPVVAHQGATPVLGIGTRGQFLVLNKTGSRPPEINHLCMRMEGFDREKVLKTLAGFGISPRDRADTAGPVAPLKSYVTMRMPDRGGAAEGTPELYFTDPDGILIQLQDTSYCGGDGPMGNICKA